MTWAARWPQPIVESMSTATPLPFPIRDRRFELDDVPRAWHPAGPAMTRYFDNLSLLFPHGEAFFIRSVKAFARELNDPELSAAVRAFYGQEAMHGREHRRYNRMLRAQGVPVAAMEGRVARLLEWTTRRLSPRARLAVTCSLEHFTASMAHVLLNDPRVLAGAPPAMVELWRWHAVEEFEHREVAYDVYRAVGGTFAERNLVMLANAVVFWAKVIEQQIRLMRLDGTVGDPREWARLLRFLFVEPGPLTRVAPQAMAWFRPGFHPGEMGRGAPPTVAEAA